MLGTFISPREDDGHSEIKTTRYAIAFKCILMLQMTELCKVASGFLFTVCIVLSITLIYASGNHAHFLVHECYRFIVNLIYFTFHYWLWFSAAWLIEIACGYSL